MNSSTHSFHLDIFNIATSLLELHGAFLHFLPLIRPWAQHSLFLSPMEPVKVSKSPYTNVVRYASGYDHPDFSCIFVHAGAGYHSTENEQKHLRSCRKYVLLSTPLPLTTECSFTNSGSGSACLAAMALLRNGSSAVDAVEAAIRVMEDDPITNCGFGSNLNFDGRVEADASIMDCFGRTGAIGAVPRKILISQTKHVICRT